MSDQLNIGGIGGTDPLKPNLPDLKAPGLDKTGDKSFEDIMKGLFFQVDDLQKEADDMQNKLMTGEIKETAPVFIAAKKAELAFQTLLAVRNRIVDAYNELQQIRI